MTLTEDEVIKILKLLEQSSFDELHLETGDLKLVVKKNGCGVAAPEADVTAARPVTARAVPVSEADRPAAGAASGSKKMQAKTEREGLVSIKAPMLGIAYRRPSPESPPYVEVGSYVKEDDTVCLIEVMKVFTAVKAGVRGYVAEILIESNVLVEYGQPMFLVKPDEGSM